MPMFLHHNLPRLRLGLAALLLAVWGLVGARAAAAQEQVLVIANASVPADSISKTQLLDFYTGEVKLWDNGERVVVFDLKTQDETREVFYDFLGKTSSRIMSIWLRRKLSGEGDPPERLPSEAEVLARVQATPGAIGFVALAYVPGDVKVLTRITAE